jgi:hypothetical protein
MFERVPSCKSSQAVACLSHQAPRLLVSAVWHWRSPLRVQSSSPSQRTRQVFPPESWLEKQSKQTEQCVGNRLAAITTEKRQAQLRWSDLSRAGLIQCVAWWSLVLDLFGFSVPLLSFGSVDKHRGLAWWDFHSLSLTLRRPRPRSQGVPIQLGADKPAAVIQPASRDTPHHTMLSSLCNRRHCRPRIRHHRNERQRKATRNWTPSRQKPRERTHPWAVTPFNKRSCSFLQNKRRCWRSQYKRRSNVRGKTLSEIFFRPSSPIPNIP